MKKRLPLIILAVIVFLVSMKASETYAIDRGWYYGYFTNSYDSSGDDVLQNNANDGYGHYNGSTGGYDSIPPGINDPEGFINFIIGKLNSTRIDYGTANNATNWDRTGAAFMIQTMIGTSRNRPPTAGEINDWASRIRALSSAGRINWNTYVCAAPNTFYQISRWDYSSYLNDVAWYNATGCGQSIVFYDGSWNASYIIRRACANPIGSPVPLQVPWSGQGRTTVSDGTNTGTAITVQPGASLTFNHYIRNNGPGAAGMWFATYGIDTPTNPWTAQYYNNLTLSGSPVLTRSEQDINYYDGSGGVPPAPGVLADGFSVRWTRTQNFAAGTYSFRSNSDDGERLYVDGVLILDDWVSSGAIPYNINRSLTAGTHTIVYEYFESGGPGLADLEYTNYTVLGGTNSGSYSSGQEKLVNTQAGVIVPLNAAAGTQYCRRILWDWRNSSAAGEYGLGTAGMGQLACATVAASYNLTPSINVQINGGAVAGNRAEPGDTVTFTYAVNNTGNGASSNTACTIYGLSRNGYYTPPNPSDSVSDAGFVQPAHGCPRNFAGATNTTLVTETVPAASIVANKSVCRSLYVTPAIPAGTPRYTESCVYVTVKPYARVYGGDVSAGGGLVTSPNSPNSCTQNSGAAVIGWNKRSASSYAGAGVQFAVYAISTIFDTASSLGGGSGPPATLSFRNTSTNVANGNFGGLFGTTACIQDHYSTKPSTTTALPASIGAGLASGSYSATGNVQLSGGVINPGTKVNIYVDGNLYIGSNITYAGSGSWTSGNVPMLRLVVRGNVFIDNDVTQLDGLYVAQPNGAVGGTIYTCALGVAPFTPMTLNGSLGTQCDLKLTVNGGFVAKQVHLLRTIGTLRQSNAAEASTSGNIAETFNYNPALWISQPPVPAGAASYDAINSLPPIL